MPVPEATVEEAEHGRSASSHGWFVLNLSEAAGLRNEKAGAFFPLDTSSPAPVNVLYGGAPV